jgi:hypothetical protein
MSEQHSFPGKIVNTIIALKIVAMNFNDNITDMLAIRTTWTPAYGTDLNTRIDTLTDTYMGVNARDALFSATKTLKNLVGPTKHDLALVKTYIDVDFKTNEDRGEVILRTLGYPISESVSEITQPQLVAMLTTFKRELTAALTTEITAHGMPVALLNRIVAAATTVNSAHAVQESLKESTKTETAAMIQAINQLYAEIIGLCKVVAKHYISDSAKKKMFTFSTIMRDLGDTKSPKDKPDQNTKTA